MKWLIPHSVQKEANLPPAGAGEKGTPSHIAVFMDPFLCFLWVGLWQRCKRRILLIYLVYVHIWGSQILAHASHPFAIGYLASDHRASLHLAGGVPRSVTVHKPCRFIPEAYMRLVSIGETACAGKCRITEWRV